MRLVTNSFAPLARIFGKSEYFLYRLSLSRQLSATLSATACKYLAAVGRGHTLTEAVLLGALTLLRLESLLHFVFPPSKFPQYWAFFGDLRLANARRYRGSLADFDYSARTASLSIANREKIHAAIQYQARKIGFCALRGRAQRTNRCKRARCEVWIWWNVGSKPAFFAIFSTFIAHIVENCTLL